MGMESYNLLFIHENSRIVHENGMWKLSGTSDLPVSRIRSLLSETCSQAEEKSCENSMIKCAVDSIIS